MATEKRRPTIIDIARKAEVSFKTVSRVLNENPRVGADLRSRVLKAMAELDYQPNLAARSLAGRRGYAIALLVDGSEFFREDDANAYFSPYLVDLQAGALIACREQGYHFFVEPYDFSVEGWEGGLRAQLSRIALDGVMLAPPSADRLPLLDALDDLGIPYIRFAPGLQPERSPSVASDEDGGARAMAEHLLALGHRRIGLIGGPQDHIAAAVRVVAFQEAVAGRAEVIFHTGDFTFEGGLAAGDALLTRDDRPSAIFATNDFMAAGVVTAATRRGLKVPEDVSIGGFDDSAVVRFLWPPLTTVRQPIRKMAAAAVDYLVAQASGRELPERAVELASELVVRGSTGGV